jgi:hypothetical protein
MTWYTKIKKYGKQLVFGVVEVLVGALLFFPTLSMYSYMLMLLLSAGIGLILFRAGVLASIPFFLRHLKTMAEIINGAIRFFDAFLPLILIYTKVTHDIMHIVVEALNDATRLLGIHTILFNLLDIVVTYVKIPTFSEQAVARFLLDVETTCPAYDSAGTIFYTVVRDGLHSFSCPLVRYYYPIPWLFDTLTVLLGWTYHGSAAPFVDRDQANCQHNAMETPDAVCVVLGTGFFIVEVLVPMAIAFIFVVLVYTGLVRLCRVAIFILSTLLYWIRRSTIAFIVWLEARTFAVPYTASLQAYNCIARLRTYW